MFISAVAIIAAEWTLHINANWINNDELNQFAVYGSIAQNQLYNKPLSDTFVAHFSNGKSQKFKRQDKSTAGVRTNGPVYDTTTGSPPSESDSVGNP